MLTRSRRLLSVATTLVVALLLAACGGSGADGPPERLDGSWTLIDGQGPEGPIELVDGHPVTLTIDGEDWGGTAACNTYGGTAEVTSNQVTVRELVQTEMACPEDGVMEAESAYLAALRTVDRLAVDEVTLLLQGEGTELTFERDGG